jgi:predicted DNA-binding transcriptional regulator YafY
VARERVARERVAQERVVDPYGLVCKAGIWYLVADSGGEPRLFRVSRMVSAAVDEAPVRRRDGVELAELWELLRHGVEDRLTPLVGANVEVTSPAEVRADLAAVAAEVAGQYSNISSVIR